MIYRIEIFYRINNEPLYLYQKSNYTYIVKNLRDMYFQLNPGNKLTTEPITFLRFHYMLYFIHSNLKFKLLLKSKILKNKCPNFPSTQFTQQSSSYKICTHSISSHPFFPFLHTQFPRILSFSFNIIHKLSLHSFHQPNTSLSPQPFFTFKYYSEAFITLYSFHSNQTLVNRLFGSKNKQVSNAPTIKHKFTETVYQKLRITLMIYRKHNAKLPLQHYGTNDIQTRLHVIIPWLNPVTNIS